jgi:drug/metabolite transporter (DMT)-like permease
VPEDSIMTTRSDPLKATVWMIGAMVSFSLMAVSGRELATSLNTFEIMLYRSIIGLLIVLVIGFFAKTLNEIRCDRLGLHLFRNLAHFCITNALALAPAIVVIPLDFMRLPLISVIGFLIYGEAFELPILLGAGIIFIAILLNLKAEKQRQSKLT